MHVCMQIKLYSLIDIISFFFYIHFVEDKGRILHTHINIYMYISGELQSEFDANTCIKTVPCSDQAKEFSRFYRFISYI